MADEASAPHLHSSNRWTILNKLIPLAPPGLTAKAEPEPTRCLASCVFIVTNSGSFLNISHFLCLLSVSSVDEASLAVAGRALDGSAAALPLSDGALAVSGRALDSFFGGGGMAGSHRKNSCRSVLTASGHSIMIM